jgi:hypothetical protein
MNLSMHARIIVFSALAGTLLVTCTRAGAAEPDRELDRLAAWLTGSFSSAAQAQRDTSFFDIRLHIVPIWKDRADARWFYVEQAAAGRQERPYRQRVYRLTRTADGWFESAVFSLNEPLRFAGAWKQQAPLAPLSPDSLSAREGCSVFLAQKRGRFTGGTRGNGCASDLRGAAYATSEVTIEKMRMLTLDRGWSADGKQAWGSTNGPYQFRRVREP